MSMPFQELTGGVIAAAIEVQKTLKPGLDEKLYERARCIEFEACGITCSQQPKYEVSYKDKPIGLLMPDLIVEDTLIVSWYGPWENAASSGQASLNPLRNLLHLLTSVVKEPSRPASHHLTPT